MTTKTIDATSRWRTADACRATPLVETARVRHDRVPEELRRRREHHTLRRVAIWADKTFRWGRCWLCRVIVGAAAAKKLVNLTKPVAAHAVQSRAGYSQSHPTTEQVTTTLSSAAAEMASLGLPPSAYRVR